MAKTPVLPPYPAQAMPGDYIWVDWWRQLQLYMKDILKELEDLTVVVKAGELSGDSGATLGNNQIEVSASIASGGFSVTQGAVTMNFKSGKLDVEYDPDSPAPNHNLAATMVISSLPAPPTPSSGDCAAMYLILRGSFIVASGIGRIQGRQGGSGIIFRADVVLPQSGEYYLVVNTSYIM